VPHTDAEILALQALGESAGTAADDEHMAGCAHCREELARLTEIVAMARHEGAVQLQTPPRGVWQRIAADVDGGDWRTVFDAAPQAATVGEEKPPPAGARARARRGRHTAGGWRRPRGKLAIALAGLAAGLIIGAGAATGIAQLTTSSGTQVIATSELRPLPQFPQWHGAAGTAVMNAAGQQQMNISLQAPREQGFYEVWLLGRDGTSMISLGDLNASHTGSFTIPEGTDLEFYSRIDISLQPFDGSTLHSKTSVVRGSVPQAAGA
jgi:hypothetical protein